jgi:transcriptional regulator with XRE-family HTH domain
MDSEASNLDAGHLGQAIRELREERGIPSERLAETAEVDKAHLNRAENHGRNLTLFTMFRIAGALGVSLSALIAKAEEIAAANRR